MPLLDLRTATMAYDRSSGTRIALEHVSSVLRHMTPKRALNLIKSERERILGRHVLSSMPFFLKVESTGLCNLDCRWCTGSLRKRLEGQRSIGSMTPEQFRSILDQAGEYLFRINLYGFGEPLLFPETYEMIRDAADRNIGVTVSSNMNTRNATLASDILNSGLELLIFSCHGTTRETVQRFMGEAADIRLALENVERLVRLRDERGSRYPRIQWQFCMTGFNEHQMNEAETTVRRIGMDSIRFIRPLFPTDAGDEWYSSLFPRRSVERTDFSDRSCSWPYRGAYINWDGGLLPCCKGELDPENDYGNVFSEGISAIWNGLRYRDSRKLIKSPDTFIPSCRTLCSACPVLGFAAADQRTL
jgi:MoaA/NifB/PqqE/SkfB family radical SAM enzyme